MLTTAQLQALKTAILAESDATVTAALSAGATGTIADWYNGASTFVVWRDEIAASELSDFIVWANLTPSDVPDASTAWTNRALACQGKQFNLQNILLAAQGVVAVGRANVRSGLQDALSAVPSGVAGASQSGGWAAVRTAIQRVATRGEKIFATGTGTAGSPGVATFSGLIRNEDIVLALGS